MQMRLSTMEQGQVAVVQAETYTIHDGVLELTLPDGSKMFYSLSVVEWFQP